MSSSPAQEVPLVAGDLTLTARVLPGASITSAPGEDGSTQATVLQVAPATTTASAAADVTLVEIVPPDGTTATVLSDGSATLADATGALVGGFSTPTGPHGAALVATADGTLDVVVPSDATQEVGLWLASSALLGTVWGDQEGGRSLSVSPTAWARAGSLAAQELVWSQLVAREPEADATTMHDQLLCHMLGAPTKDTWNLEPWRPEVDLVTLVATKCNPTETDAG
ncbi:DUF2599 domain-containing protein [Cellulomonas soli]|uniref:DUF2599 domain-containing protein n=1 Tax=Cellulomonas soli TaxID=931535 RepID=UPI0011BFDAFB|nr:DUF2599 domain-containing protein [Cellulomonas soli]NYI58318.1 hypothetical protein [Cellulomonas soli]